ncbi:inositol monophosphatase family protein [Actinomadura sp. B10D3]|uniref:inositol monophosphatase family protein n=1 Tax=Actinomadura sp. B10D3 TaxID=3153557 RepID=UPI00325F6021
MAASLSALGQLALDAAQAGNQIVRAAQREQSFEVRAKSSHRDLVTDVDHAAEAAIARHLQQRRPGDAILGEETGERPGTTNVQWIIDPIDGTANFARGRTDIAVAVAAKIDDEIRVGALVRPGHGDWLATDGEVIRGSRGTPSVSGVENLQDALVSVSVSVSAERRPVTLAVLQGLLPEVQDFRRIGSTSCDMFAVATGELDAYVGIGTKPWDIAAGWAVTRAAGGRCLQFPVAGGHTAFVLGTPEIADQIAPLVEDMASAHTAALGRTSSTTSRLNQSVGQGTDAASLMRLSRPNDLGHERG